MCCDVLDSFDPIWSSIVLIIVYFRHSSSPSRKDCTKWIVTLNSFKISLWYLAYCMCNVEKKKNPVSRRIVNSLVDSKWFNLVRLLCRIDRYPSYSEVYTVWGFESRDFDAYDALVPQRLLKYRDKKICTNEIRFYALFFFLHFPNTEV